MKKGISLISLVLTIAVTLLLVSIVIFTISDTDTVDMASETNFKNDLKAYDEEIKTAMGRAYISDRSVTKKTFINLEDIAKFSKRLVESRYKDLCFISDGELTLYGDRLNSDQRKWAEEIKIKVSEISSTTDTVSIVSKPTTWTNEDVSIQLAYKNIPDGYYLEYKTLEDENWIQDDKGLITENTTITARIYNERL